MKIKMSDCMQLCAVFLQLEDALAVLCGQCGDFPPERLQEAEKQTALILRCANLAVREIASEYVHLKTVEKFSTTDGIVPYDTFSKFPVNIIWVKKNGVNCRFKLYPLELITESGDIEVQHTYMPQNIDAGGDIDFDDGKMSARIIAYGTAAEYCIICGLYEEAMVWDKRYKDSIFAAKRTVRPLTVAERRWH